MAETMSSCRARGGDWGDDTAFQSWLRQFHSERYEKYSLKGQMVKAKKTGERMIAFQNGVVWCFQSEVPPPPPPRATLK